MKALEARGWRDRLVFHGPPRVTSRLAFAALVCHAVLAAVGCKASPATELETAPSATSPARADGKGYGDVLASLDAKISSAQAAVAAGHPTNWMSREQVAALLLDRAQLTGQPEDYLEVQTVLDDAFTLAPTLSGPVLLAARFNVSIHRLDEADFYLTTIAHHAIVKDELRAGVRLLAAQIALARGDYAAAGGVLEGIAAAKPELGSELAIYYAQTGRPEKAEALYKKAFDETKPGDGRRRAWIRLQLALLAIEHGRYEDAQRTLNYADRDLPGWWFVEEHIAETFSLLDRDVDAAPIYEKVARDTGLPQHLDALAAVYARLGRNDEARALVARAGAAWEKELAELPEAAMGHGLEHYLRYGTPEQALELARRNYLLRPGGEAHVGLARAYLKAGQPQAAIEVVERALKTPYRSAALHDTARQAYSAAGRGEEAGNQVDLCFALNPRFKESHSHSH